MNAVPSMKRLVSTLIQSLPQLLNVSIFLSFIFLLFGILGVQLFSGNFYNKCRTTEKPQNSTYWESSTDIVRRCSKIKNSGYQCPEGTYCGNPFDFNISLKNDNVYNDMNIQYAMATYDNIFQSLLAVFQIITKDGWSQVLFNMMDTTHSAVGTTYGCAVIVIGSFFLMNLILAVIIEAFNNVQEQEEALKIERENQKLQSKKLTISTVFPIHEDKKNTDRSHRNEEKQQKLNDDDNKIQSSANIDFQSALQQDLGSQPINKNKQPSKSKVKSHRVKSNKVAVIDKTNFSVNQSQIEHQILITNPNLQNENASPNKEEDKILPDQQNKSKNYVHSRTFANQKSLEEAKNTILSREDIQFRINSQVEVMQKQVLKRINTYKPYRPPKMGYGIDQEAQIVKFMDEKFLEQYMHNQHDLEEFQENQKEKTSFAIQNLQNRKESIALELHKQFYQQQQQNATLNSELFDIHKQRSSILSTGQINNIFAESQRLHDNDEIMDRVRQFIVFRIFFKISSNKIFGTFITICTIVNTVFLALDRHPISDGLLKTLEVMNTIFFSIFACEMIIKLLGIGIKFYVKDKYNIFDFILVLISSIDIILSGLEGKKLSGSKALLALRAFRLLRVFKLAKSWKSFQQLLLIMGQTLKDISTFSILLGLFIFTYSIIGMEWFAYNIKFDSLWNVDKENGVYIQQNFNTFFEAVITVFVVLTGDSWADIYFKHVRAQKTTANFFFITLIVVGQYILLMLFLAILLENFDEESLNDNRQSNQSLQKQNYKFKKFSDIFKKKTKKCRNLCCKKEKKKDIVKSKKLDQQGGEIIEPTQKKNKFKCKDLRKILKKIVLNEKFDYMLIFFIILSSIHLAIDNPLNDPNGKLDSILWYFNIVFTVIFFFEAVIKIITYGFLFNGKDSYLRNYWNIIDFCIVITSILSTSSTIDSPILRVLKVFRMARILRPLRLISKNKGLQLSIEALIMAIPNILNVLLITVLFFLIFMIIGVNFLKGLYYYCDTTGPIALTNFAEMPYLTKWDCINTGAEWLNIDVNFDSIFHSFIAVFAISQMFSWSSIMYQALSFSKLDMIPSTQNVSKYYAAYFIVVVIVISFFISNLFVGVVVSTYNKEKEILGQGFLLTKEQKKWVQTKLIVIQSRPKVYVKIPTSNIRLKIYRLINHRYFDRFIQAIIFLSTISQTLIWAGQPQQLDRVINLANFIFSVIFMIEAVLKITGQGLRYFKDGWNLFDFAVSLVSVIGVFLDKITQLQGFTSINVVRSIKIIRIFKILRNLKSLRIIFETFIITFPALINVGGLLLLLVYMFTVFNMNMFAKVKLNGELKIQSQFQNIFNGYLTLFRMTTGDSFLEIMIALSKSRNILYQCEEDFSYSDYQENGFNTNQCGRIYISTIVFVFFCIIVILIFLNLFIAIILEGYQETAERNEKMFNNELREQYKDIWSHFDQDATGKLQKDDLIQFLFELGEPLGLDKQKMSGQRPEELKTYVDSLSIPIIEGEDHYSFLDVLNTLVMFSIVKLELKKFIKKQEYQANQDEIIEELKNRVKNSLLEAEQKGKSQLLKVKQVARKFLHLKTFNAKESEEDNSFKDYQIDYRKRETEKIPKIKALWQLKISKDQTEKMHNEVKEESKNDRDSIIEEDDDEDDFILKQKDNEQAIQTQMISKFTARDLPQFITQNTQNIAIDKEDQKETSRPQIKDKVDFIDEKLLNPQDQINEQKEEIKENYFFFSGQRILSDSALEDEEAQIL